MARLGPRLTLSPTEPPQPSLHFPLLREGHVSMFIVSLRSKPLGHQKLGFCLEFAGPTETFRVVAEQGGGSLGLCRHEAPAALGLGGSDFLSPPLPLSSPQEPPSQSPLTFKGATLPSSPSPSPPYSCPSQEHMENSPGQWLERQERSGGGRSGWSAQAAHTCFQFCAQHSCGAAICSGGRPEGEAGSLGLVAPLP